MSRISGAIHLEADEYDRILNRLQRSWNQNAACAFDLAIETSLRQSMLFKIRWEWIDFSKRMIRIPFDTVAVFNKGVPMILPL